ncbi:disease susceptibility protein LOV1-like [Salvia miltiorrhiza]|uniref:disease susceptibility protein LOV1-like n=1 Tax=Salvia miltiorrhiza TaxID=226208 RepID=UPI0025ABD21C|nr:disease susceptibility protein LOV1-like [Salvia miltiorrhiza]
MAAEAAISSAVALLGDLLIQKVKSVRGVEGKVQSLKEELEWMQSFLKHANKKQAEDEGVRNWIKKIKEVAQDAAQDAEDAIEMFLVNAENDKNRGLLKRCTSFAKRMYHLDRIGAEIESIRARLDAIDKSRERYGIKILEEAAEGDSTRRSQVELRRQLAHWEKDEHLVGMEDDVKKLLRESVLDEERRGISIAVIEGMGGIGKSTLAREIYNHPNVVAGRFECRAWVVVSSEFTPQETIKQLIFQLPRSKQDNEELLNEIQKLEESMKDKLYLQRKLQEMLHEQLQGKNYLIVLDDVWEKEHWEYLRSAFPNEQDKTSRLILTSRNKIITKYDHCLHKMKLLDSNKSWELFLKKAFTGSTNGTCPQELEIIGRHILEKCDGLPLAISVVGGLLVETQTKSRWQEVLNQINSYLDTPENNVPKILELSYQNLSPQLKSCFLCLAFFKEDSTIPSKRLVNIWIAQGLIQQDGNGTTDEIARGYLNELINRSMVQIDDFINDDRVKHCRLHDLLRDLCLSKAEEEMGLKIVKGEEEEGVSSESSYKPRHHVVYGKNLETFSFNRKKHIRSIFLLNVRGEDVYASRYWKSFQLLKILDLDGSSFQRLPDSFRFLLGLKYFRIRRDPSAIGYFVLQLPSWFDRLKKLEVLDVEKGLVLFPDVALKMERLRHFHIHSVYGRTMMIENWKSIESLKLIRLEDWLECSSRLMASCHLRDLGICITGMEGSDEFSRARASLEKMTNLVELHLEITMSFSMEEIIPNLESLTILKLDGGMLKCPAASVFPPNLSHLTLCNLNDDPMQELGKLPKLQYLTLSSLVALYMCDRMKVLHDGFPCLKALSLQSMGLLRCIDIEEGGMPHLKQLEIHHCPNLEAENLPKHIIVLAG